MNAPFCYLELAFAQGLDFATVESEKSFVVLFPRTPRFIEVPERTSSDRTSFEETHLSTQGIKGRMTLQ